MCIYHVLQKDGFGSVMVDFWTICPPEEAKNIKEEEQMDRNTLYAVEYDVERFNVLDFFHRIDGLPVSELRKICEKDAFLKELIMARVSRGGR